ncbi:Protein sidekick-2, partial [Geodia barretti]
IVAACVVSFNQDSYTADEGGTFQVMVTIDPMCSIENDVIVSISSINGTAVGGSDFVPVAQMLMFTDATPTLSFSELMYSVVEGNQLTFEVVFESPLTLARDVEVNVTLIDGTAIAPDDYNMLGPMVLTLTGSGGTAMVNIVDDALAEVDEMFEMMLSSNDPSVSIVEDTATVTINDSVLVFQFNQSAYTVDEGDSVPVWTTPLVQRGTLHSTVPQILGVVVITVPGDKLKEDPEDFILSLESKFRLSVSQAALTISDTTVTLDVVGDSEVTEGENITLNITAVGPFVENFMVNIQADPANKVMISPTYVDFTSSTTQSQGVEVNNSVTLTCWFIAGNPVEIVWMKDGVPLSEELASTSDQNPMSSIGAVGVISCSIISCGQVSILFDIDNDNATRISLNTTTADVDETLGTVETTSEATITTLGRVHEGMSQSCNVTYGRVVLREEIFNYTLENVAINVDVRAENLTLPNRTGGDSFVVGDDVVLNCSATNPHGVDRDLTIRWFRLARLSTQEGDYIMPNNPPANTMVETGDGYVALILPDIKDNSDEETVYICKAYNRLPNDQVDEAVNVTVIYCRLSLSPLIESLSAGCEVNFDQTSYTVDEGGTFEVMVTIVPMGSIENDVIVNISSADGTAVGGNDFVPVAQMLTFNNSIRQIPVSVEILNDTVVEDQEVLTLTLVNNDDNVTLPDRLVEVSITDRSSVTVEFDKTGYVVAEGESKNVVLRVNGGTLERDVDVQLTVGGGATEGADYTALPASVVLTAGTTSSTVTFTAANDTLVEGEEIVQLTLGSSDTTVTVGPNSSVAIRDTTITLSFSELMYSVVEGNNLTFEVVVEPPLTVAREVEVTVMLIDGTAIAPDDYMPGPIVLTLTGSGGTAMVNIVNDTLLEVDEMFEMMLSSNDPSVLIVEDTATVTINDSVLVFQFNHSAYTVDEGDSVPVMVTWVNPQMGEVEVRVTVTPSGTLDYYSISPEGNITLNSTSNTSVVVITVPGDKLKEDPEDFILSLESKFRLSVSQAALTISDTTVTLDVVGDSEVTEGENITLNITAVGPFVENFMVNIQADPADKVMISPTFVNFTSTTTQVSVTIGGVLDEVPEGNETVTIIFTTTSANVQDFDYNVTVVDATVNHTDGPQSQGVEVNNSVTLTCWFIAGNPVEIVWMKDGVPLSEGGPNVDEGEFVYRSTLSIAHVEFSNCGNYTCSMRNVTSPPAELGVYQLASTSDQNPMSSIGAVGVISCSIISCGQVSILFDIDNDNATRISLNTTTADVDETLGTVETTSEATITTLGRVHEGMSQSCNVTYGRVVLREEIFNYTLENVAINVDVRAENLTLPNRTGGDSFVVGDDVVLNCSATNPHGVDRDLTIRWFRLARLSTQEGDYIMPNNPPANTMVETGDGYVALILPDIKDNSDEETVYICKAYNRLPNDQVDEAVNVTVISGPVVRFPDDVVTINVGDTEMLECNTAGSNPMATNITITVRRPGEANVTVGTMAGATTRLGFDITGNLSLNGSVYNCAAVNEVGPTSMSFTLVVRDVPGEVDSRNISSVPLTLLVLNVTSLAPISNNAEITNYTVTVCITATDDCLSYLTLQPHAAVLTVPTVTYNVSVRATNVVGSSNSDTTTIVGTNQGAAPIVTGFALSPAFLILEWTLSPLVFNVTDPPNNDLPAESVFFVEEFVIRFEGDVIARIAETSYLVRIPDGQIDPADGSDDTMLPFEVEVIYSDININTTLNTTSFISVAVPNVEEVADINRTPLQTPVTTSGGFSFQWAPPAQVDDNQEFIEVYNVVIDQLPQQGGRGKRQVATNVVNVNQPRTDTDFQFTGGQPFTDYNVSVDAVLNVNGDTTRVTALSPNTIKTEEGKASAPQNPGVTEIEVTTVRVVWGAPVNPNGIISKYRVRVQLTDGSEAMTQDTTVGSSSHYEVYAVITGQLPDTSVILSEQTDTSYVTFAGRASSGLSQQITVGTGVPGDVTLANGQQVNYDNRRVSLGANYYFFVRLYSSQDTTRFSDSEPVPPPVGEQRSV